MKIENLKLKIMKENKATMLGKRVHICNGLEEMEQQFAHDVATVGREFTAIAEKKFDLTNPWDQMVMMAILTNMLAAVEVQAEVGGENLEQTMKNFYELNKDEYRQQTLNIEH